MVSRISPTQMPVRQLRTNERSTTRPYRMSLRAKRAAAYLGDGGYRAAHRKSGDQVISDNYFFRKVLIDVKQSGLWRGELRMTLPCAGNRASSREP